MRTSLSPFFVAASLLVLASLLVVGCGTSSAVLNGRADVDPFFTLAMTPAGGARPSPAGPGETRAYTIETHFVRPGGETLMAPRLTVYPRQRSNVTIVNQTAFVENFGVEIVDGAAIADPLIGIVQDGLTLELCVDHDGDAIAVAYRAYLADLLDPIPQRNVALLMDTSPVTIQLPAMEIGETAGVRRVVAGTLVRIARLATRDGDLDVLMRVDEVGLPAGGLEPLVGEEIDLVPAAATDVFTGAAVHVPDFPGDFADAEPVDLLAWLDASGDDLRIEIEAVHLPTATATGQVLDRGAADTLGAADLPVLRRLEMSTRNVPGAAVRTLLQESHVQDFNVHLVGQTHAREVVIGKVRSGLQAQLDESGRLRVTWATLPVMGRFETDLGEGPPITIDLPEWHSMSVAMAPVPGEWLVTFGRTPDAGTLAARVRITSLSRTR